MLLAVHFPLGLSYISIFSPFFISLSFLLSHLLLSWTRRMKNDLSCHVNIHDDVFLSKLRIIQNSIIKKPKEGEKTLVARSSFRNLKNDCEHLIIEKRGTKKVRTNSQKIERKKSLRDLLKSFRF